MAAPQIPQKLTLPSLTIRRILLRDELESQQHRPRHSQNSPKARHEYYDGPIIHPSTLCNFCNTINLDNLLKAAHTDTREVEDGIGGHHWSPQDLEEAAARCPLCRMFREELAPDWQRLLCMNSPRTAETARGQCRFKVWAWNGDVQVDFFAERKDDNIDIQRIVLEFIGQEITAELQLSCHTGSAASSSGVLVDSFNPSNWNDPSSWSRITELWHDCSKNHQLCNIRGKYEYQNNNQIQRLAKLPTRVVVADYEKHGKTAPFLLETAGMSPSTFAALSHCWGTTSAAKTTRETYPDYLTKIKFNKASKTFLDAIHVCRKLGIPYIWIDSLCIIQHDENDPQSTLEDFLREVKWMPYAYARAVLTIAATGASEDQTMGLLGWSRSRLREHIELSFRANDDAEPDGFLRISRLPRGFSNEVWDSTLFTRGWIFQERLLSTRYLHFGNEQWYWQCRQGTQPELELFNSPYSSIRSDLGMLDAIAADSLYFHNWWAKTIETYSGMSFLRQRDRFMAMETFMAYIKGLNRLEYAAGMWLESLHLQLDWNTMPGGTSSDSDRPKKYKSSHYIPSWSWLSSDLPIDMGSPIYEGDDAESRISYRWFKAKFVSSQDIESQIFPANLTSDHMLVITGQMKAAIAHPSFMPRGKDVPLTFANASRLGPMLRLASHEAGSFTSTGMWFNIMDVELMKIEAAAEKKEDRDPTKASVGYCRFSVGNPKAEKGMFPFYCVRLYDKPAKKETNSGINDNSEKGPTYKVMLVQQKFPPRGKVPATYTKVGTGYVSKNEWFEDTQTKSFLLV